MSAESVLRVERQVEPLREKTVKALREAILSDHLKPGQRLVERDLCEQTGVSRSSIREALRYLESEGLVQSRGPKGMFVSVLTRRQAMEIYEVRAALEGEAARHFAERAGDADVAALREVYRRVEDVALTDPAAYGREIDRFFEVLFAGAGNATAQSLMRSLRARINLMRNTTIRIAPKARVKGSMAQMGRIVDAIGKRDAEAAAAACRGYVARSAEFAETYFSAAEGDAGEA